jgi:hypothetical protein
MSMFSALTFGSMHRSSDATEFQTAARAVDTYKSEHQSKVVFCTHARDPQQSAEHVRSGGWVQYCDMRYAVAMSVRCESDGDGQPHHRVCRQESIRARP